MTQLQLLADLSRIAINVIFWSGIAFPILIGVFWPWWKSSWGWNIVSLEIALSLALVGSILQIDWGLRTTNLLLFGWLTVVSLWLVPIVVGWRTVIILREQYRQSQLTVRRRATKLPDKLGEVKQEKL